MSLIQLETLPGPSPPGSSPPLPPPLFRYRSLPPPGRRQKFGFLILTGFGGSPPFSAALSLPMSFSQAGCFTDDRFPQQDPPLPFPLIVLLAHKFPCLERNKQFTGAPRNIGPLVSSTVPDSPSYINRAYPDLSRSPKLSGSRPIDSSQPSHGE